MRALAQLTSWPAPAAAGVLGWARPSAPGPEEVAVVASWGDIDRRFYWASVTKLCTALAVLVAVEEGTLSLEEGAGSAAPPGATVAHLLAHASGLGPSGGVLAPPGRRRIYSNRGFEILAHLVEFRSGLSFGVYLREAVIEPLGMAGARFPTGASAAAGMYGSCRDLLALGAELLRPRLVGAETLAAATAVAFPGLAGVLPGFGRQDPCDWGLGPEVRGDKQPHWTGRRNSPRTFGHFGQSGCFLWVDPDARAACAAVTEAAFGPWAAEAWPQLSDGVVQEI